MEIVYINAEDLNTTDTNLHNIIAINSNNYWDSEDDYDFAEDTSEQLYA